VIDPPVLAGRDHYERVVNGWVDNIHDDAFTHTVRLRDSDAAVEVSIEATAAPAYEIRAGRAQALSGVVDRVAVESVASLAGTRMVVGLSGRVREATGAGAGAALVLDAVIEAARLARQVTRVPRDRAERAVSAGAWECWQLDRAAWADLPNSCFTYSDAAATLFASRSVTTPVHPDLYSPRPGQRRVFERQKVSRLTRTATRLSLFQSMYDNMHGFELLYEVDRDSGRVVVAESRTPKLPYAEVCAQPQSKVETLIGEVVDAALPNRIQSLLGGVSGCAQLYDLTSDLVKLVVPPRTSR
jgi:hypothetical protein